MNSVTNSIDVTLVKPYSIGFWSLV